MKRVLALLLAFALLFGMYACGSGGEDGKGKQAVSVNLPDNGKKSPSEKMITEDVRNALASKNQHASLVGIETVKSLTNEGSYSLTLSVTAETKYADWTYEADLSYTKYDQGWMLDDVDWNAEAYQLSRLPDEEEISAQIQETLEKSDWSTWSAVGFEKTHMEIIQVHPNMSSTLAREQIGVLFDARHYLLHGVRYGRFSARWNYDAQSDCWDAVMENGRLAVEAGGKRYYIMSDISGDWEYITISNLETEYIDAAGGITVQGFDAEWNGKKEHFTHETNKFYNDSDYMNFSSDYGTDMLITMVGPATTFIMIGDYSNGNFMTEVYVQIEEELPPVS